MQTYEDMTMNQEDI